MSKCVNLCICNINNRLEGYEELEAIFASPNKITEEQAKHCIEIIRNTDAVTYTKNKLEDLKEELEQFTDFDITEFITMQK